jgi:ADP-ribose pyrophosphatase
MYNIFHTLKDGGNTLRCHVISMFGYPRRAIPKERAWNQRDDEYDPPMFIHPNVEANMKLAKGDPKRWAQDKNPSPSDLMNVRRSRMPVYIDGKVTFPLVEEACFQDKDGKPLNPCGRTGVAGLGVLGCWGPNHAADIILCYDDDGIIRMLSIRRSDDSKQIACPGGMVDRIEKRDLQNLAKTLRAALRELEEEALRESRFVEDLKTHIKEGNIETLYGGVVDDVRNTDHAFMVTTVYASFLSKEFAKELPIQVENDEVERNSIQWRSMAEIINDEKGAFASHKMFFQSAEMYGKRMAERAMAKRYKRSSVSYPFARR